MSAMGTREKTINLRITSAQKAVIERAAESSGKAQTAFILDATLQCAEAVLVDRDALRPVRRADEPLCHCA